MEMMDWANREIDLALRNMKETGFDYDKMCYESAAHALEALLSDNHSGMSIQFTMSILNRLVSRKPLTPIEDTPKMWKHYFRRTDGSVEYQCSRYTSLYKIVHPYGNVEYCDFRRFECEDVRDPGKTWTNAFVSRQVSRYFPIRFPYSPENKPFRVQVREFLYDKTNGGDFDTMEIIRVLSPDGNFHTDIHQYYVEIDGAWVEVPKESYLARFNKEENEHA